jgi:hypothetical protein
MRNLLYLANRSGITRFRVPHKVKILRTSDEGHPETNYLSERMNLCIFHISNVFFGFKVSLKS